jgi:hypothetical protein
MNRKQYILMVALVSVFGLIGGALSSKLFMTKSASSEKRPQNEEIIRAEAFELVDDNGNRCAELKRFRGEPRLRMLNGKGAVLWSSPKKQRKRPKKEVFRRNNTRQKTQLTHYTQPQNKSKNTAQERGPYTPD